MNDMTADLHQLAGVFQTGGEVGHMLHRAGIQYDVECAVKLGGKGL